MMQWYFFSYIFACVTIDYLFGYLSFHLCMLMLLSLKSAYKGERYIYFIFFKLFNYILYDYSDLNINTYLNAL